MNFRISFSVLRRSGESLSHTPYKYRVFTSTGSDPTLYIFLHCLAPLRLLRILPWLRKQSCTKQPPPILDYFPSLDLLPGSCDGINQTDATHETACPSGSLQTILTPSVDRSRLTSPALAKFAYLDIWPIYSTEPHSTHPEYRKITRSLLYSWHPPVEDRLGHCGTPYSQSSQVLTSALTYSPPFSFSFPPVVASHLLSRQPPTCLLSGLSPPAGSESTLSRSKTKRCQVYCKRVIQRSATGRRYLHRYCCQRRMFTHTMPRM